MKNSDSPPKSAWHLKVVRVSTTLSCLVRNLGQICTATFVTSRAEIEVIINVILTWTRVSQQDHYHEAIGMQWNLNAKVVIAVM